jgi:hypothetical protein
VRFSTIPRSSTLLDARRVPSHVDPELPVTELVRLANVLRPRAREHVPERLRDRDPARHRGDEGVIVDAEVGRSPLRVPVDDRHRAVRVLVPPELGGAVGEEERGREPEERPDRRAPP